MPKNKRESLIYTVLMCFTMVLWMSIYNVAIIRESTQRSTVRTPGWAFPSPTCSLWPATGSLCRGLAKGFAFRYLVKPGVSSPLKTVIAVSSCMVSAHGYHHVLLRGGGDLREDRTVEPGALHLADKHSEELCHGAALPAFDRWAAGAFPVQKSLPGGLYSDGGGTAGDVAERCDGTAVCKKQGNPPGIFG